MLTTKQFFHIRDAENRLQLLTFRDMEKSHRAIADLPDGSFKLFSHNPEKQRGQSRELVFNVQHLKTVRLFLQILYRIKVWIYLTIIVLLKNFGDSGTKYLSVIPL